jgi:uracil phosphoribosyltransferase
MKNKKNSLLEGLVYQLRDPKTKSSDFRANLERIGEYLGIEIAKNLKTEEKKIETILNKTARHNLIMQEPVLITILRAGIPLYQGMQRAYPNAIVGFIGASRDEKTLKSTISYIALPEIKDKTIILCDTMLATGGSLIESIEVLKRDNPKKVIIACAIASKPGINRIKSYDKTIEIYSAAIDPKLNERGYILPGLGDAGDRCYGRKV